MLIKKTIKTKYGTIFSIEEEKMRNMDYLEETEQESSCLEDKVLTGIVTKKNNDGEDTDYCAYHHQIGKGCPYLKYEGKMQRCDYYAKK